jgi:1,4-dihydroxy-2-naphthoyl-CoA hydrolase
MNELLGIRITELGENYIKAIMPVDKRTHQAYGILHGGASAALAETLGSIGSVIIVDPEQYICWAWKLMPIISEVRDGFVTGTAIPLHIGLLSCVGDKDRG